MLIKDYHETYEEMDRKWFNIRRIQQMKYDD